MSSPSDSLSPSSTFLYSSKAPPKRFAVASQFLVRTFPITSTKSGSSFLEGMFILNPFWNSLIFKTSSFFFLSAFTFLVFQKFFT